MVKEFKNFISQRNTIDMLVGIVIGYAMTNLTKSLVRNLINPLIGLFLGKINFSSMMFTVGKAQFKYGSFINSLISFIIIALVIFIIAHLVSKATNYSKTASTDTQLLTEIRDELKNK